jgi:hypothetical protein
MERLFSTFVVALVPRLVSPSASRPTTHTTISDDPCLNSLQPVHSPFCTILNSTHDLRMSFAELPSELQIEIFSYLDPLELKAARAVCRRFRQNASPPLFKRVVACARYKALGCLRDVSLHSVYASYVNEIVFDGSIYEPTLASPEISYQTMADKILPDLRKEWHWIKHKNFKRYQELYQEQEEMRKDGILLAELSRALGWMRNVTTITYSPGPHTIPCEVKLMKNIVPRGTNIGWGIPQTHNHFMHQHHLHGSHHHHGFHHLIGAIYEAQYSGIRELRVLPADQLKTIPGNEFSLGNFDFDDPVYLEAGKYFFGQLRKLDMCLSLLAPDLRSLPLLLSNVRELLAAAKDLEEVAFTVPHWRPSESLMYAPNLLTDRSLFFYLGLSAQWPKLRSLHLGGIYVLEEEMLALLSRHKATLCKLSFRYCSLRSGTWANIVDEIVINTTILPCVLDCVNETMIGPTPISDMGHEEMESWQYIGEVKLDSDGRRYFVSAARTSFCPLNYTDFTSTSQRKSSSPAASDLYMSYEALPHKQLTRRDRTKCAAHALHY